MAVGNGFAIVCLVTRICLTSAIVTAKVSLDPTNISRPWDSYLPVTSAPFPKHPNHQYDDRAIGSDPGKLASSRDVLATYPIGLPSVSNNRVQKSQTGPQRFPTESHQDDVWLSAKVPNASPSPPQPTTTTKTTAMMTTTTLSGLRSTREYQRNVPRRFAYQDIEVLDGYLTDELDDDRPPYHGNIETTTYLRRDPHDFTAAIKALDRFLSRTLNADGYNSKLHLPPNPVLALVLSRYGRYVPGTRNPRVYAYMATNNIHNYQPFGKFKYECDDEPIYAR